MTITISNQCRRMLAFNLAHDAHLKSVNVRTTVVAPDGRRYPKTLARRVPRDLTLTAKGTPGSIVSGLAETILQCPDVVNALRRRDIKFTEQADSTTAKPTASKRSKRGRR